MTSGGDSLRPNKLKQGDLILHFVGDEERVRFIVLTCVETILADNGLVSMAAESLVSVTLYENLLN